MILRTLLHGAFKGQKRVTINYYSSIANQGPLYLNQLLNNGSSHDLTDEPHGAKIKCSFSALSYSLFLSSYTQKRGLSQTQDKTALGLKDYYGILKISPKASQAKIKAAFYKLSLIHHPDRNVNTEKSQASNMFTDITEAYNVLGNIESRRDYDRKLALKGVGSFDSPKQQQMKGVNRGFARSYDEWTKAHYGKAFERKRRDMKAREDFAMKLREKQIRNEEYKRTRTILLIGLVTAFSILIISKDVNKGTKPLPLTSDTNSSTNDG